MGRGRGLGRSTSDPNMQRVTEESSDEDSEGEEGKGQFGHEERTNLESKSMDLERSRRKEQEERAIERHEQQEKEAELWLLKDQVAARHKKEQEAKDAEIWYLKEQAKIKQKEELDARESDAQFRKDLSMKTERWFRQEQEVKDNEIQRLSGLLDGARSMVRVLSSFSDIKMDDSKDVYGSMPVLENMKGPVQEHREKLRASETTVPIENITKIHETGGGKYHGKVVESGKGVNYDSDHEEEKLEWYERYFKQKDKESAEKGLVHEEDRRKTRQRDDYERDTRGTGGGGVSK